MFDVLPPGSESGSEYTRRVPKQKRRARVISSSVSSNQPRSGSISVGPRTVEVNWKLPARLRRPIREQLQKERRKKKFRQAIVQFDRRPINTRPLLVAGNEEQLTKDHGVVLPQRRVFNRGVEHHTGDTYKHTKPKLHVAAPPYVGRAARPATSTMRRVSNISRRPTPQAPPHSRPRVMQPARPQRKIVPSLPKPSPKRSQKQLPWLADRDVPFSWGETKKPQRIVVEDHAETYEAAESVETRALQKPRRRLSLPFNVQIWPFSSERDNVSPKTGKKKVQARILPTSKWTDRVTKQSGNLIILLVGCLIASFLVWNLRNLGKGFEVLADIRERGATILDTLTVAQTALAEQDFKASEQAFADAETSLRQAQSDIDNALSLSRHILRYMDVTGTVRSGENLLEAGESLTVAGQHISRGVAPFFEAGALSPVSPAEGSNAALVDAIRTAQTEFGFALTQLETAEEAIQSVDSPLMPSEVKREVEELQTAIPRIRSLIAAFHKQSSTYLTLLGAEHDRQYLVLFANNHEIRPIGGFIGTVGLIHVDRGHVEKIDVNSVYDGDGQLKALIAPPDPLLPIVDRWYLRDANWFVDYEVTARKIAEFFEKEGGSTVDGVLLMTPDVIKRLLEVTGPIEMPEYEVTVSAENFVEVTQGEVTYDYDKELNKPKQFLADLTPVLLNKLFESEEGATEDKLAIVSAIASSLQHKELMMYFKNKESQQYLRDAGWAGVLPENQQGFLYVNNANIGGHKSDQFVDQEIDYRSEVLPDGDVDVVLTIRRTHNGPTEKLDYPYPEGENPAEKDNVIYQRVFAPMGAQLIEAKGFTSTADVPQTIIRASDIQLEADPDVALWQQGQTKHSSGTMIGSEAGYTFFSNWIITQPGQTSVALYRYRIPKHVSTPSVINPVSTYSTYIFKQPGDIRTTVRSSITLPSKERIVHSAPQEGVTRESDRSAVYRGSLTKDVLTGVVFEKSSE